MRARWLWMAVALAAGFAGVALAGHLDAGDQLEIAAVRKATVIPTQAVRVAEAQGGVAYGYGMEVDGARHWYEVDVLRDGAPLQVRIDPTSARVVGTSPARGEDAQGAHALAGGELALGAAIAHAERAGGGPALEADAGGTGASVYVDVDVIQQQGRQVAHYRVTRQGGSLVAVLTGHDR